MLYYLVDALPALLGSMATLWAVCSPRHWFLRSCFIAALLLLFLFIPAYELLVAGCMQVAVIISGIMWWRKCRNTFASDGSTGLQWRISLRNLLLFTVLAAVAMAVLANFPESPWLYWVRWAGPGFVAGCATLFALWLVVGTARWPIRVVAAIAFVCLAALSISLVKGLSWVTEGWTSFSSYTFGYLFEDKTWAWMSELFAHFLPVIAIGEGLLCAWLALFVKTGWFDPFGDLEPNNDISFPTKAKSYFRIAWIGLTVAIAILPVTWLIKLALPREQVEFGGLKPASFELLNDAGIMIDDAEIAALSTASRSSSTKDLVREISRHSDAIIRMKEAFEKPSSGPRIVKEDMRDSARLIRLITFRLILAEKLKSVEMQSGVRLDQARLWHMNYLDATANHAAILSGGDASVMQVFWNLWSELSVDQRREILLTVSALENAREQWPILLHRQRIEDANAGWESHLQVILDDWLGKERYAEEHSYYQTNRTKIRLMLLELALQTYQEGIGHLPDSLDELVPSILKELPVDPYGKGSLKYRRTDDGYTLYSVGPNGTDDDAEGDDFVLDELMQPATPTTP